MARRFFLRGALGSTWIAIAIAVAAAAPVHAQGSLDAQSAAELNRRSAELYRQGRYADSIVLLREAYRRKPEPVIQYNVARACEKLADWACAIDAYEIYLATGRPKDSTSIEARVAYCRDQLAAAQKKAEAPATVAPVKRSRNVFPLIVTALGGVGAGVGLGLAVSARSLHDEADRDPTQVGAARKQDLAVARMSTANTVLIAGGAVAVAGAVWWIVDAMSHRGASSTPATPAARVDIGAGSVAITVAF